MRAVVCLAIVGCVAVGCSSDGPTDDGAAADVECNVLPPTSFPSQETVNTIMSGTLPLVLELTPNTAIVCPGDTVQVVVRIANSGQAVTAFAERLIMGCGSPPELVVGELGPIDLPANQIIATTASFTVPQFAPGSCGFSVYGYPTSAEITVAPPATASD